MIVKYKKCTTFVPSLIANEDRWFNKLWKLFSTYVCMWHVIWIWCTSNAYFSHFHNCNKIRCYLKWVDLPLTFFTKFTLFTNIGTKITFFTKIGTKFTFLRKFGTFFRKKCRFGTYFGKKCNFVNFVNGRWTHYNITYVFYHFYFRWMNSILNRDFENWFVW